METMQVLNWGDSGDEFVIINAEDYNPEFHKLPDAQKVEAKPKRTRSKKDADANEG